MKIAIISSAFLPVRCGLSNTVYNLSKNFTRKGHEVTVITPYYLTYKGISHKEVIQGVKLVRFLFPAENFYRYQSRLFKWIYVRELFAFPIVTLKLMKFLKKEQFDIVNLQFVSCYTPSVLIAKTFVKFKLMLTLQGYSSHIFPYRGWFNRWIFKQALKKADYITAISEYVLKEAERIEPCVRDKSTVIPNGMDFKELEVDGLDKERYLCSAQRSPEGRPYIGKRQNVKIEEPFILSIGSLYKLNGVDLLITSFKDVLEKGHRCQLVIIGDGQERKYLEKLAALLGIDNTVHFFSDLSKEGVDRLVQRCLFYIRTPRIDPIGEIYPYVLEREKPILSTGADIESISKGIITMLNNGRGKVESRQTMENIAKPYIFSLGRFEHYKRFDLLVRAFKKVVEMGFDVTLLIGGEGGEINRLCELVSSLGLEEKVYFLGFLDRERVIIFYQRCQLFVAAFENEPFGLSALEAMAVGKPVVVPRTGAMPELIKDGLNGITVEPGSEAALADAISRLLKDSDLRERLGFQARRSVSVGEKYRWDRIAETYLSQFAKVFTEKK